jgi:hypothetical protein
MWRRHKHYYIQEKNEARHWWLMPVILATWEAEIRMILVKASLGK